MASYEVGEDGEDSAATAQSLKLLYADGVFDVYFNYLLFYQVIIKGVCSYPLL